MDEDEARREREAARREREASWATPVDRYRLGDVPAGAHNANVEGRQPLGAHQGFGQLWRKTYGVRLTGAEVTPAQVVEEWRSHFGRFWPAGNEFLAPVDRISPGDVALLNLATMGSGGPTLSTGVRVIYADDESFTFMNPQGHMFAGWITFSAYEREGATSAQVQVLIRTSDPLWEATMRLFGFRKEDAFWHATLRNLATHFGVRRVQVWQKNTLVDAKVQWTRWTNVWHNAAIRSFVYDVGAATRRLLRQAQAARSSRRADRAAQPEETTGMDASIPPAGPASGAAGAARTARSDETGGASRHAA